MINLEKTKSNINININNYITVLQAYLNGEEIEYRTRGASGDWFPAINPTFDFDSKEYRVKPKEYYRPYTSGEEAFNKIQEHSPSGWLYNTITMCYEHIICIASNGISTCKENYSYEEALNIFVYPNESKFGVKLDEED